MLNHIPNLILNGSWNRRLKDGEEKGIIGI